MKSRPLDANGLLMLHCPRQAARIGLAVALDAATSQGVFILRHIIPKLQKKVKDLCRLLVRRLPTGPSARRAT